MDKIENCRRTRFLRGKDFSSKNVKHLCHKQFNKIGSENFKFVNKYDTSEYPLFKLSVKGGQL